MFSYSFENYEINDDRCNVYGYIDIFLLLMVNNDTTSSGS